MHQSGPNKVKGGKRVLGGDDEWPAKAMSNHKELPHEHHRVSRGASFDEAAGEDGRRTKLGTVGRAEGSHEPLLKNRHFPNEPQMIPVLHVLALKDTGKLTQPPKSRLHVAEIWHKRAGKKWPRPEDRQCLGRYPQPQQNRQTNNQRRGWLQETGRQA